MKKYLFFAVFVLLAACSSFKKDEPILNIKNDIVLHDGFDLNMTDFSHSFLLNIKSIENIEIKRIDYKMSIPNYNNLSGSFKLKAPVTLNAGWDFKELNLISETTSYLDFCEQMNAMFRSKNDVFSMNMNLTFITSDNESIQIKDLEVKIKNSGFWDKLRNTVVEKGCGILAVPEITALLFKFFGN